MEKTQKLQHNIALAMLGVTAIVWGAGFLLNKILLENGFGDIPLTLNAVRFSVAALALIAIFGRKIKLSKQLLFCGAIGGLLIFFGFTFQILGLKYTTPSSSGFFTASYALFVPFILWIFMKKRPTPLILLGVASALVGLVILNTPKSVQEPLENEFWGNMLTLAGSLFFALQIVWTEHTFQKKSVSSLEMTVTQMVACAILFVVTSVIFESKTYATVQINMEKCWWSMAIVSLLGTSFAYFSQTYGQKNLAASETSILIACESPISAILSVALGMEEFTWQVCVGGFFVLLAVVLVEILPNLTKKKS